MENQAEQRESFIFWSGLIKTALFALSVTSWLSLVSGLGLSLFVL